MLLRMLWLATSPGRKRGGSPVAVAAAGLLGN